MVRQFTGEAIFVLQADVVWSSLPTRIRKLLLKLQTILAQREGITLLVLVDDPLPMSMASQLEWIGNTIATPAPTSETTRVVSQEFADLRDPKSFDTEEWQMRIEQMGPEEVERLIKGDYHLYARDRINAVRAAVKERFAHKDEVVDAMCAASVAQVPTVLMGPPGTAKSNIIRCFCEGLGLCSTRHSNGDAASRRYFEYLLTRYTTPEEIFGPIHVQDLIDKQVYRRETAGYLPESHIVFLDEIFKASSAILNTLLTLLNERLFYNAGRAVAVPLVMVFAASNESPSDENLAALYDRFPIRLNCASSRRRSC